MLKQAIASVLFCFTALGAYAEVVNVDNAELARLAASGVPVIDVRTEGEWKQSGVISGSKLLTYFDAVSYTHLDVYKRQVGISGYTVHPPRARKEKPKVFAFTSGDINKILAVQPDLVFSFSNLQADIASELIKAGVPVLSLIHI